MAFNLIANTGKAGTQNGVTSDAIDTTGANLIIVNCGWYSGVTADGTLTDSKSNTWTSLTKQTIGADPINCRLFYSFQPTVGSGHTFTFNGTSIYPSIEIIAVSGAASSPFFAENGATATNVSVLSTGSVTPNANGDLVIAGLCHDANSSGAVSIDNGMTISNSVPHNFGVNEGGAEAYLLSSTGAINPQWNITNSSVALAAVIATFKAAAADLFSKKYNVHIQHHRKRK